MSTRVLSRAGAIFVVLLMFACEDSDNCTCGPDEINPPLSDLVVSWDRGIIFANLMPIVPPDPIVCQAWLILENKNQHAAFSNVTIPTANVILVRNGSTLGMIPIETDWDGVLAASEKDTVLFFKNTGPQELFNPPCGDDVFLDFKIQNADGDTMMFQSDTLTFECAF